MQFILFLSLQLFVCHLHAEDLYKGRDPSGVIRYSDKPFPGAKAFSPHPLAIVPRYEQVDEPPPKAKNETINYQLSITMPENNQIFSHDIQAIPVKLNVTPSPSQKTTIRLWLNGESLPQSDTPNLLLPPLARGTYQLQAELLDPSNVNQPLAKSAIITFYQQRAFVKK